VIVIADDLFSRLEYLFYMSSTKVCWIVTKQARIGCLLAINYSSSSNMA